MGKAEGERENWHGHVTAVTVAPSYRRLHLAARMMQTLEDISTMLVFGFGYLESYCSSKQVCLLCTMKKMRILEFFQADDDSLWWNFF